MHFGRCEQDHRDEQDTAQEMSNKSCVKLDTTIALSGNAVFITSALRAGQSAAAAVRSQQEKTRPSHQPPHKLPDSRPKSVEHAKERQ